MKTLLVILALCMAGCDTPPQSRSEAVNGCSIRYYGQGVYYFGCASDFGAALADFSKTHVVITITSYSFSNTGTSGYWVVARTI